MRTAPWPIWSSSFSSNVARFSAIVGRKPDAGRHAQSAGCDLRIAHLARLDNNADRPPLAPARDAHGIGLRPRVLRRASYPTVVVMGHDPRPREGSDGA